MKYVLDHTGRPSFKEEKIADFVCDFAEKLGLEYTNKRRKRKWGGIFFLGASLISAVALIFVFLQ